MRALTTGVTGLVLVVMLLSHVWWLLLPAPTMPPLLALFVLLGVLWMVFVSGFFKVFEFYKFRGRYASQLNLFHHAPRAWVMLLLVPYGGGLLGLAFLKIVDLGAVFSIFFVYSSLALLLYSYYIFPIVLTHQRQK